MSEDERTGPASEASAKRQTAIQTSLTKQVVRIFAMVCLVLYEREVRVLWKSVAWTKRVKWRLLFDDRQGSESEKRRPSSLVTFNLTVPEKSALGTHNEQICHVETSHQAYILDILDKF